MTKEWIDRCVSQRVPYLPALPAIGRYIITGQVLMKDQRGGIAPLGSFEHCDTKGSITVYPSQSINTTAKNQTLAASMGLCALYEGYGFLSFRFAHQTDGPDFALADITEGESEQLSRLLSYRGFDPRSLLGQIEEGETVACLGAIPGLMRILVSAGDTRAEGYTVGETLKSLPAALLGKTELNPWYAARLKEA